MVERGLAGRHIPRLTDEKKHASAARNLAHSDVVTILAAVGDGAARILFRH